MDASKILTVVAVAASVGSIAYTLVQHRRRQKAIDDFNKDPSMSTAGLKKAFGIPPDQPWPGLF